MWPNFLVERSLLISIAYYYLIERIITLPLVFLQLLGHLLRLGLGMVWSVGRGLLAAKLTHSMCWTATVLLDKCVCYGCLATCVQKQRVLDGWILPEETRHSLVASRAIREHVASFCLTLTGATFVTTSRRLTASRHSLQHRWNWSLRSALTGQLLLLVTLLEPRSVDRNWWIVVGVRKALLCFGLVLWILIIY